VLGGGRRVRNPSWELYESRLNVPFREPTCCLTIPKSFHTTTSTEKWSILHRTPVQTFTVRKDSAATMPPFRMYNEPVTSMRKPALQQLCEHFEQPTDGTVPTLKARLQKYLRNHRARLQDDVRYKGLFGHQDPAPAVGSAQPATYAPAAAHSDKNIRRPDQERLVNGPRGSPRESLTLTKHVPSNANEQNVGCVGGRPRSSE